MVDDCERKSVLVNMEELHQFATDLSRIVVEQSLRTVSRNFTNVNGTELFTTPQESSNSGGCFNDLFHSQEHFIPDNELDNTLVEGIEEKYPQQANLKCYAHELCCDIINSALHNIDSTVREASSPKSRSLSCRANNTVNCHQLSTERIELFCYCDNRATITVCAAKRRIPKNNSGKLKPITKAKRKKLKYKKKLEKELSKLKPGKSKVSNTYFAKYFVHDNMQRYSQSRRLTVSRPFHGLPGIIPESPH